MNVVIVNDFAFVNGGASTVAIQSALALAQAGHHVHYFSSVGPACDELLHPQISITLLNEKPYYESGGRRALLSGIWDQSASASMKQLLCHLDRKDTVVHFHSHQYALSTSVFKPAFDLGFPSVFTCHEYGIACPYASFFDHSNDQICTRKPLSLSCLAAHCNRKGYDKKLWTYCRQTVQNTLLRVPDRIRDVIFVSEFSRRILNPFVSSTVRRHTIPNPVNAQRGVKRTLTPESPFLFVGLLTSGKDPVLVAKAAFKAGVDVKFVGDGELKEQVLLENPRAVVTGWLQPKQVQQALMSARAIVLPTKWYETQGLVVQEAAALGVPAIVSNVSAAQETVEHGLNGLIVPPDDVVSLASSMLTLSDDFSCRGMGEAAYDRFWANPPTTETYVSALLQVYEGALTNG